MKKSLYSIADQKSNVYLPPFLAHNDADAQRQMLTMMQKEQNMISMYPEDFTLTKIGSFDDSKGLIESTSVPTLIVNLNALLTSLKEKQNDRNSDSSEA